MKKKLTCVNRRRRKALGRELVNLKKLMTKAAEKGRVATKTKE